MSNILSVVAEFASKHADIINLVLSSLRGAKNAVVYSAQVRIPDVVLVALMSGGGKKRMLEILKPSLYILMRQTGFLSMFVFLYRLFSGALKMKVGAKMQIHSFGSAALACFLVYRGGNTPDNMQLFFFLLARILSGVANLGVEKETLPAPHPYFFPFIFAMAGGLSLWLFEHHPKMLTPNMRYSMKYLYKM